MPISNSASTALHLARRPVINGIDNRGLMGAYARAALAPSPTQIPGEARAHPSNGSGFPRLETIEPAPFLTPDRVAAPGRLASFKPLDHRPAPDARHEPRASRSSSCGLAPWQISRVIDHIDRNLESRLLVHDLAVITRLSASYFARVFRSSFKMSPHTYILHRRIEVAKVLMQDNKNSLSAIAQLTGFSDQAHMSRTFRRVIGETPRNCRRRQRGLPVS